MNNEFKKTASTNQTVYTLENATAGGSSSAVNATVSSPMGGVQKRGQIVTSSTDKKVPATTPRNFVAKNAKTGGAGAHKDKKKAEKQGSAKHKKPYMEALQAQLDQLKSKVAEGVATTMPMPDAVKLLRQYGADHFKTTSNELHFYKNGRHLSVDLVMNPDTTRSVSLSSLNAATRGLKGQGVAEGFNGEYDDEAGMAESNLHTMARAVKGLMDTIDSNDNLPEWCQEKIAKAEMMVTGVWDYLLSQKEQGIDPAQGVAEGAKVDRQAKHITASMMKKGKSKKDAESIAWAHIKHPKSESADSYFESLNQMVERQLEPTMDLDAWNDNFQNADPQKYHQFKNKSPEKKK